MRGRFSITLLPVVLCLSPTLLLAGSRDFEHVVRSFELQCQCKHTRVPLSGLWKSMFKMAPQAGERALDVAVFEDQDFSSFNTTAFEALVRKTLDPGWQSIIRVQSKQDEEQTCIYGKLQSEDLRLMILTLEPGEAVIIEAQLTPATLLKGLEDLFAAATPMSSGKQDEHEAEE